MDEQAQFYPPTSQTQSFPATTTFSPRILALIVVIALSSGGVLGFTLSRFGPTASDTASVAGVSTTPKLVNSATEVGSTDTKTFSDSATGVLETGGLGNEGTHKLIRPGGASQTVYLISSLVDLDAYIGKSVEVFGQTLRAQKAPWLMDVGRLKLVQ
jgi:hypothetical protein